MKKSKSFESQNPPEERDLIETETKLILEIGELLLKVITAEERETFRKLRSRLNGELAERS